LRQLGLGHGFGYLGDLCRSFTERFFALLVFGYIEKEAGFLEIGLMLLPGVDNPLEGGLLFENALGLFAVVPKFRLRGDLI
jgi:hypothetical protein